MNPTPVVVTEKEYRKARELFDSAPWARCIPAAGDEAALCGAIRSTGARYVVVGVEPYRDELYATLPRGGVIARFGVGHDSLNKPLASAAGILCTNTPGALTDSVAEFAVGLIFVLARLQSSSPAGASMGMELSGRRLAIIGCGAIGMRVAQIASRGFGMQVQGFDIVPPPRERLEASGVAAVTTDFAQAVDGADVISLHIAAVPETKRFLNSSRLAACPADACLINTARGSVVDENALYDALSHGRLRAAALDVTETEPYAPCDPSRDLRSLPNVFMTPHLGSSTRAACDRMAERALRNIHLAVEGRFSEMDVVNRNAE